MDTLQKLSRLASRLNITSLDALVAWLAEPATLAALESLRRASPSDDAIIAARLVGGSRKQVLERLGIEPTPKNLRWLTVRISRLAKAGLIAEPLPRLPNSRKSRAVADAGGDDFVAAWQAAASLTELSEQYPNWSKQKLQWAAVMARRKGATLKKLYQFEPRQFADHWNAAADMSDFLRRFPVAITRGQALGMVTALRKEGRDIKEFEVWPDEATFVREWNRADGIPEFLAAVGIDPSPTNRASASRRAAKLRDAGHILRRNPTRKRRKK